MGKGSLNDWRTAMIKHGLPHLEQEFHFDRTEDDARIISSRLPHWAGYRTSGINFLTDPKVEEFLNQYKNCMIRMTPKKGIKGLPRFSTFNFNPKHFVNSLDDCYKFIEKVRKSFPSTEKKFKYYDLALAEHEPSTHGGVIISNDEGILADTLREHHYHKKKTKLRGLVGICEDETPDTTLKIDLTQVGHLSDKTQYTSRVNKKETEKQKKIILEALKYLELTRDSFNPLFLRGYFEFIYAKKSGIKFWDYKINQTFSK